MSRPLYTSEKVYWEAMVLAANQTVNTVVQIHRRSLRNLLTREEYTAKAHFRLMVPHEEPEASAGRTAAIFASLFPVATVVVRSEAIAHILRDSGSQDNHADVVSVEEFTRSEVRDNRLYIFVSQPVPLSPMPLNAMSVGSIPQTSEG